MKKILFVVSTLEKGGPTKVLFDIVNNINKDKFQITILTLSPEKSNTMLDYFQKLDIGLRFLNMNRIEFTLFGKNKLEREIKNIKPNIIHTMGVRSDYIVTKINLNNIKHLSTIHCFAREEYIYVYGKFIGRYLVRKQEIAIKKMDFPICCSYTLQEKYNAQLEGKKLYTIQNGIGDAGFRYQDSLEKNQIRETLNLPFDKEIFVFVGRLTHHKNPELVIKSFLKAKRKNGVLLVLGNGTLYQHIRNKYSNQRNIAILGNVNNVQEYLSCSDYYISASKTEGLPLSVIEAGFSGLTMILSDIPQHKELLLDKKCKFAEFTSIDMDELSNIINNISKFSSKEISNYFKENFSAIRMADDYEKLYIRVLNGEIVL